jgi:hypothetical protein
VHFEARDQRGSIYDTIVLSLNKQVGACLYLSLCMCMCMYMYTEGVCM